MEVILIESVDTLGTRGQVVKVADGYGRNHLLPKKLAIAATPQNRKWVEQQRQKFLKQEAHERSEAEELAQLVESLRLTFARKSGEHGALFGSVTAQDIAGHLAAQGYKIERRKIHIPSPLKTLGEHAVSIRLHPQVTAKLKVVIEAEGGTGAPTATSEAKPEAAPAAAPDTAQKS